MFPDSGVPLSCFQLAAESGLSDARTAPSCHGTTLWLLTLGWLQSVTPSFLVGLLELRLIRGFPFFSGSACHNTNFLSTLSAVSSADLSSLLTCPIAFRLSIAFSAAIWYIPSL